MSNLDEIQKPTNNWAVIQKEGQLQLLYGMNFVSAIYLRDIEKNGFTWEIKLNIDDTVTFRVFKNIASTQEGK